MHGVTKLTEGRSELSGFVEQLLIHVERNGHKVTEDRPWPTKSHGLKSECWIRECFLTCRNNTNTHKSVLPKLTSQIINSSSLKCGKKDSKSSHGVMFRVLESYYHL